MNKEKTQNQLDFIKVKKEELQQFKENFKIYAENLFSNFKNESFNPILEQIKTDANYKFNDYIINPKMKLKESNDDVNTALSNLQKEIEEIIRKSNESLKTKSENLETKINLETAKIKGIIMENKSKLQELNPKNQVLKDETISIEDIAKPAAIITTSIGLSSGVFAGIALSVGFSECFVGAILAGSSFAGIGAIIGGIGSVAGYGFYRLWKSFNKEDDLINLTKKAKDKFINDYDVFCKNQRQQFDEHKKKVIDDLCNSIEKNILIIENTLNQFGEATIN